MLDIFISHSSADEIIANQLINVLRNALNIDPMSIRCTSVPGYKLEGGVNTDDRLREEVNSCRVLLGLVSAASLESIYVLFELGARWGQRGALKPLVYTKSIFSNVSGPLANLHIINISIKAEIYQLIAEIADILDVKAQNPALYDESITELLSVISEHVGSQQVDIDAQSKETFELTIGLTKEQEVLLVEGSEDPSGRIAIIHTKDGYGIQTNGKLFCNTHDGRIRARWEHAIDYLRREGLIESRNAKNTVFGLSVDGYSVADELKAK